MGVSYFASDYTSKTLRMSMAYFGMDVSAQSQSGNLRVNTLPKFTLEEDFNEVMESLSKDISRLPRRCKVVIIDAVTNLVLCGQEGATLGLFYSLNLLCSEGNAARAKPGSCLLTPSLST
jgi:archaellum biogenesis ATPase FlaH